MHVQLWVFYETWFPKSDAYCISPYGLNGKYAVSAEKSERLIQMAEWKE